METHRSRSNLTLKIPKEIISEFDIKVKGVVDAFFSGRQRSKTLGSSPEFAGHRPVL